MSSFLKVTVDPPVPKERLLREVLDPEIQKFEEWFKDPRRGASTLVGLEREILRTFLWWKINEEK